MLYSLDCAHALNGGDKKLLGGTVLRTRLPYWTCFPCIKAL
jgi:hypothetical protein